MNNSKTTWETHWNEAFAELLGLPAKDIEAAKKADAEENARRQKEQELLDFVVHNGCLNRKEKDAALDKLRAAFRDRVETVNCRACGKSFRDTILAPTDYNGWDYALGTPFGHGNVCFLDVSGVPNVVIASILDEDRRLLASFAIAI